jgi:hypothetical protein
VDAVDRGDRGMNVGRLGVVEEPHAVGFGDLVAAVTLRSEARQPVADRRAPTP